MNGEIEGLISSVESSSKRVKDIFGELTENQLNWKPASDKWSVGECISHLVVTNKTYYPALNKITKGEYSSSLWAKISPLSGVWGNLLLKTVSPENAKKTKTAGIFQPSKSSISKEIINELEKSNNEFISYLKKLGNVDLKKTKISSPVTGFITYSLDDTLKIITYHEVRHINQAKLVTETEGFPK